MLADEAYLASLPEDSLGHWYLRFMRARGFAPAGLLEARERGAGKRVRGDAEHEWFYDRLNVMHDLWHVLTGYGTDELGESALVAFSQAQIPNRSFPLLLARGRRGWARRAGTSPGRATCGAPIAAAGARSCSPPRPSRSCCRCPCPRCASGSASSPPRCGTRDGIRAGSLQRAPMARAADAAVDAGAAHLRGARPSASAS